MYLRDQWQVSPKVTLSFGARYEYFPIPTRGDRGLERYNLETNMMEIGGLGGVPKDLGISMQKNLFAPRLGATYRITDSAVLRGGFGITNDPYSLARSMRTNHPILLQPLDEAAHSWTYVRRIEEGIPTIPGPRSVERDHCGAGERHGCHAAGPISSAAGCGRGTPHSRSSCRGGSSAKSPTSARVRSISSGSANRTGHRSAAAATAGSWSRNSVAPPQRSSSRPIGDTSYNALQTRLNRRFNNGFSFNVNYTLSRSEGLAGASNSDQQPRVRIPDLYDLNHARLGLRPHARVQRAQHPGNCPSEPAAAG